MNEEKWVVTKLVEAGVGASISHQHFRKTPVLIPDEPFSYNICIVGMVSKDIWWLLFNGPCDIFLRWTAAQIVSCNVVRGISESH